MKRHARRLPSLLAGCLLLASCADEMSPEDRVRATVTAAEEAAEERDLSKVMELVADSYSDDRGRDKASIRGLMHGYFLLNQSVHLLVSVDSIEFPANDVANAQVTVGMLGNQSQDDWALAAEVHEFDVRFRLVDDEWRLQGARRARRGDDR
jgi:hypothetical protein